VPSPAGTPAGTLTCVLPAGLTCALPVGLAMTLPLVLAELGGAVGGPPAEHAVNTAVAARLRIGMVRRAAFIDILRRGQTVGGWLTVVGATKSGRNEYWPGQRLPVMTEIVLSAELPTA